MAKRQKTSIDFLSGNKRKGADSNQQLTPFQPSSIHVSKNWSAEDKENLASLFDKGKAGISLERGGCRADFYPGLDGLDISKSEYARRVRLRHPNFFSHCTERRFVVNFSCYSLQYI